MKKLYFLQLLFFCIPINCFAQLNDFTLSVNATPATCIGNGTLNFTTSGTNSDATMAFTIYLLPNLTLPIATTPATSLTGLNPGEYRIVASQTLGTSNNSQQQDIVITNQIVPLNYTLAGTNANCLGGGTLTANIISGNPVSYQIITGPIITPLQTTNSFSDLPPGTYNVRVIDDCGQGVVKSFTIIELISNPNAITILQNEFPESWAEQPKPACDSINVGHRIQIAPNANVVSPLQFIFTVFPPDGSPAITVTHSYTIPTNASGSYPYGSPFSFTIPYFDSSYNYNVEVVDACGNSYFRSNNNVNKVFNFSLATPPSSCGYNIRITSRYFSLPLNVEFLSFPAGFDPVLFNAQHPTFNNGSILYQIPGGGPGGTYIVKITDACGKEFTETIVTQDNVIALPGYQYQNCNELTALVIIATRSIVTASFLQVPTNSGITLPYDLSNFIIGGHLEISGILIPGNYIISVTDSCGKTHTVLLIISPPTVYNAIAEYQNGCGEEFGSVRLSATASFFETAVFISGPASYQPGFPHDVSEYIYGQGFSMNSLPTGIYTIKTTDTCGNIRNNTLFIGGYFSTTEIEILRHCSSFDLFSNETHNNPVPNSSYWIQLQNPITGNWQHPLFGGNYIENTIPNETNARKINNNQLNLNIGDSGHYRILTITSVFSNGNELGESFNCVQVIKEFDVEGTTTINSILNFACSETISDVFLNVSGTGPFNFKILEKNGAPFIIDNLNDPLFTNLETGIYKFQIEDECGNLTVRIHDVFALVVFSIVPTLCLGEYSTLSVPEFPYLEYEWFKDGAENIILTTNPTLSFNSLNFNIHSGIYYVNIIYPPNPDSCLNRMLSFEINENMIPNAGEDNTKFICNPSDSIDLNSFLIGNFDENGTWEQVSPDGNLNVNIWNLENVENGFYQFNYIVNGLCGLTDIAQINLQILDEMPNPEIVPINSICEGDTLNFQITNGNSNLNYLWTGPNNFTSTEQNPTIQNATIAMNGTYNVEVSGGNCQAFSSIEISVNVLPNFIFKTETIVICEGQSATIEVIPTNVSNIAYEYVWYFNNEEIVGENNPIIEINEAGSYSVTISSGDCSITKTIEVTENTTFFEVNIIAKCDQYRFIVTANSVNNSYDETTATYHWSGPNGYEATTQTIDITDLPTGIYTIIVYGIGGCSVEGSIEIKTTNCKIPKGVSPNGDGQNDTWDLSGFDIEKVKIYNRYGLEVYDENRYKKEWYGQSFNGKLLPSATYYYYIRFTSGEEITGWVYLNREVK